MASLTRRLEISVWHNNLQSPDRVTDFVKRYSCKGISVVPEVFTLFLSSFFKGKFSQPLGVMLNYPRGGSAGMHKFTNLPAELDDIGFYDLMLKESTIVSDYKKELKLSSDMVRSFNKASNLRITLDPKRPEKANRALLEAIKGSAISAINVGTLTETSFDYVAMVKLVREYSSLPIKLTGQITPEVVELIAPVDSNIFFGVSYDQAMVLQKYEDDISNRKFFSGIKPSAKVDIETPVSETPVESVERSNPETQPE